MANKKPQSSASFDPNREPVSPALSDNDKIHRPTPLNLTNRHLLPGLFNLGRKNGKDDNLMSSGSPHICTHPLGVVW